MKFTLAVCVVVLVVAVISVNSEITQTLKNGLKDSLSCLEEKNVIGCFGQRASRSIDRYLAVDKIELLDGVSLEKTAEVSGLRQARSQDLKNTKDVAQLLIHQADSFLKTKKLNVAFEPLSRYVSRSLENFDLLDYFSQKNLKSAITVSLAIISSLVAFLFVKALIIGKIFLVIYLLSNVAAPYFASVLNLFSDRSPSQSATLTVVPQTAYGVPSDYRSYETYVNSAQAGSASGNSPYYQNHPYNAYAVADKTSSQQAAQ